jgi:Stage II sporulation protein E (SpoIIE)
VTDDGYGEALRLLSDGATSLEEALAPACATVPAWDPVVYLADYSGRILIPLAAGLPDEEVAGTVPGRVFSTGQPVTIGGDGQVRLWVPVVEGSTRTGVLAVTATSAGPDVVERAGLLGVFAGLVVAALMRVSDAVDVRRRGRVMSLPASMQWDMLPPPSRRLPGAVIAGMLEPAYEIAGDAFDYAVAEGVLHFAVLDGMGHGLGSTVLTGLAIGAYRHARRDGLALPEIHQAVDQALASYYGDDSFATGVLATLTAATGRLEWTCAGHPPPLLLRGRKVTGELDCQPTLPFGLGTGTPALNGVDLEPADAVLLYTDGVIEARTPDGELFGLPRLADLLEREAASGQPPEELVRRLVRAVLEHQAGGLRDDATLLLVQWGGP